MYTIHLDQSQVGHADTFDAAFDCYQWALDIARSFGYRAELRENGQPIAAISSDGELAVEHAAWLLELDRRSVARWGTATPTADQVAAFETAGIEVERLIADAAAQITALEQAVR